MENLYNQSIKFKFNTEKIVVKDDCFNEFVKYVVSLNYKKFLIINSVSNKFYENILSRELFVKNKKIEVLNLLSFQSTTIFASNIKDYGQDVVIVIGEEKTISVAKYYSFIYDCDLIVFPIGEFLDFTFSKFSYLSDGDFFDFYVTKEPKIIYIDSKINGFNELATIYIKSKYIAVFDNVVRNYIFDIKQNKITDFIKVTLNGYEKFSDENNQNLNRKNIWVLIRLGMAMSFFNQTTSFFGGDKAVVDLIMIGHKTSFLHAELIATQIVKNMYESFFSMPPKQNNVKMNEQIEQMSRFFNISTLKIIKRINSLDLLNGSKTIFSRINNYYHYLKYVWKKVLKKLTILNIEYKTSFVCIDKNKKNKKKYLGCFIFAPIVCQNPNLTHIFSSFGYLDNIL